MYMYIYIYMYTYACADKVRQGYGKILNRFYGVRECMRLGKN